MKRYNFLFLISFLTLKTLGQEALITENQPSIVYSLPKKELCIELEVEKTVQQPGIYFQYSDRYLATNQVFLEEKTSYQLKSIQLLPNRSFQPNNWMLKKPLLLFRQILPLHGSRLLMWKHIKFEFTQKILQVESLFMNPIILSQRMLPPRFRYLSQWLAFHHIYPTV